VTIPKAHVTWTATALGGAFGYYSVERYNELLVTNGVSTPGWQRIGKITTEATVTFDDYEGRFTVAESYRVQVYSNLGGPSVPVSASVLTKTVPAGQGWVVVSNENPAINQTIGVDYGLQTGLPERVTTTPVAGRYGQRLFRSTDIIGDSLNFNLKFTGSHGRALWSTFVTNMRSNLSYVCLLDYYGNRWFAGITPTSTGLVFDTFATMTCGVVEVTDTPSVVLS
jgi:hypothetical protein